MKKNKMMRLASMLMVAVLITTSTISGTFAKYVTKGEAVDEARVAKFGVGVTAVTAADNEMFKSEYDTTDDWTGDDGVSVKATEDVVAPGTSGTFAAFKVTGTPEVDVEVTYDATLELSGWEVGGNVYCPIEFIITDAEGNVETIKNVYSTITLIKEVEKAIEEKTTKYNAGTTLETDGNVNDDLKIEWKWAFDGNDDVKDTALGDAATAEIKLTVDCIVTQID